MTPGPPVKEQQRASALYFRDEYQPNVEEIRFTQDGDRPPEPPTPFVQLPLTIVYSDGASEEIE